MLGQDKVGAELAAELVEFRITRLPLGAWLRDADEAPPDMPDRADEDRLGQHLELVLEVDFGVWSRARYVRVYKVVADAPPPHHSRL